MNEKKTELPKGLYANKPHENAPDWVKSKLSIQRDDFAQWLLDQTPNEKGWINFDILESKEGKYYVKVDDFKPSQSSQTESKADAQTDDLPF